MEESADALRNMLRQATELYKNEQSFDNHVLDPDTQAPLFKIQVKMTKLDKPVNTVNIQIKKMQD